MFQRIFTHRTANQASAADNASELNRGKFGNLSVVGCDLPEKLAEVPESHFIDGKDKLYGTHEEQKAEYARLMSDPQVEITVKQSAHSHLPDGPRCERFRQKGIHDSLIILRSKNGTAAQLLQGIEKLTRECERKHICKNTSIAKGAIPESASKKETESATADTGTTADWLVYEHVSGNLVDVPRENITGLCPRLDLYLQERLTTSVLVNRLICYLLDVYLKSQEGDSNSIFYFENSIGSDEFTKMQPELRQIRKDYHEQSGTNSGRPESKNYPEEPRQLKGLITSYLYPGQRDVDFDMKERGQICTLKSDLTIQIKGQDGTRRAPELTDLTDINYAAMNPHIRNEFIERLFSCRLSFHICDAVSVFLKLGLDKEEFADDELYKYTLLVDFYLCIFKNFTTADISHWLKNTNSEAEIAAIYPHLQNRDHRIACLRAMKIGRIDQCRNKTLLFSDLEALCKSEITEDNKAAIQNLIKALAKSECAAERFKPVFSAAAQYNAFALASLYKEITEAAAITHRIKLEVYAVHKGNVQALKTILQNVDIELVNYDNEGHLITRAARLENSACLDYLLSQTHINLSNTLSKDFLDNLIHYGTFDNIQKILKQPSFPCFHINSWNATIEIGNGKRSKKFSASQIKELSQTQQPRLMTPRQKLMGLQNMSDEAIGDLTLNEKRMYLTSAIKHSSITIIEKLLKAQKENVPRDKIFPEDDDTFMTEIGAAFLECECNHVQLLRAMEQQGFKTATTASKLLIKLCHPGNEELVTYIISRYDTEELKQGLCQAKTTSGFGLMHIAAVRCNSAIIRALADNNPALMKTRITECTDPEHAPKAGDQLKEFKAVPGDTPLLIYVKQKKIDTDVLSLLIRHSNGFLSEVSGGKTAFQIIIDQDNYFAAACFCETLANDDNEESRENLLIARQYVSGWNKIANFKRKPKMMRALKMTDDFPNEPVRSKPVNPSHSQAAAVRPARADSSQSIEKQNPVPVNTATANFDPEQTGKKTYYSEDVL